MSVGAALRFKVFRRDNFTCQYCGKKPPEVTLECDHVVARAKGGQDEEPNLITACHACNAGKKTLDVVENQNFKCACCQQYVTEIVGECCIQCWVQYAENYREAYRQLEVKATHWKQQLENIRRGIFNAEADSGRRSTVVVQQNQASS